MESWGKEKKEKKGEKEGGKAGQDNLSLWLVANFRARGKKRKRKKERGFLFSLGH